MAYSLLILHLIFNVFQVSLCFELLIKYERKHCHEYSYPNSTPPPPVTLQVMMTRSGHIFLCFSRFDLYTPTPSPSSYLTLPFSSSLLMPKRSSECQIFISHHPLLPQVHSLLEIVFLSLLILDFVLRWVWYRTRHFVSHRTIILVSDSHSLVLV